MRDAFPKIDYRRGLLLVFLSAAFSIPARASEADAIAISQNIQARHIPYGTIIDPVFASPGSDQIVSYTRCGDSALWTGYYLAAESFRYKVTRSPEAFRNLKRALDGLGYLVNITGNNVLARCLVPVDSPYATAITQEEAQHGIYLNNKGTPPDYWVGNTSRDQYVGVFFGLSVAYEMVDDAAVRSSISTLTTRLLDFLRGHNWLVVMPNGKISTLFVGRADQQLSLLQVGRQVNPSRFSSAYDRARLLTSFTVIAPISLEVLSNNAYFKFNLDYASLYNLIRLEHSSFDVFYRKA